MSTIEWVLIGFTTLAGLALVRLWRAAEARAAGLAEENATLMTEREALTVRLSRELQARKKQSEELAAFRKRAEKAKKRSARSEKGAQDLPLGTASRLADLEGEIERVERERDRSRAEREQLAERVARLEARLEVATRAALQPTPPPVADAAPAGATEGLEAVRAELAEGRERIRKLDEQLEIARQTEARMRKRMSNQEQLYASVRAELEAKKDRLRTQEEQIQRLEALKVVVSD